ncbi:hypothetical protein NEOLI_003058 [Neolecta irregularis DAH-3]|uniref:Uncharacterized protein n=1 Tax=Neolecta irregularis (strain DAH-3) TaxID=1198029 RepID=A0A1U7LPP5_NEOID|nr:hypothetical protein NEOLI_003058 [Neolecta irregularis DAH-3]|eukprot:OLL24598.1 hypothetical protein NEOLI_003058 [Neolecta irregularis DAH-3]
MLYNNSVEHPSHYNHPTQRNYQTSLVPRSPYESRSSYDRYARPQDYNGRDQLPYHANQQSIVPQQGWHQHIAEHPSTYQQQQYLASYPSTIFQGVLDPPKTTIVEETTTTLSSKPARSRRDLRVVKKIMQKTTRITEHGDDRHPRYSDSTKIMQL